MSSSSIGPRAWSCSRRPSRRSTASPTTSASACSASMPWSSRRISRKPPDHYQAFLTLHPDVASAHNNLGRIYMQMRRFKEAIAELQETIRLDPDLFLAYFSLNSVYLYEVADLDSAIATAQRQTRAKRAQRLAPTASSARPTPGRATSARRRTRSEERGAGSGSAVRHRTTIGSATRCACRAGSTRRARSICTFSRSRRRRSRRTTRPGPSRS